MKKGDKKRIIDLLEKASEVLTGEGDCPDYCPNRSNKPPDQGCGYDNCCIAADKFIQTALELIKQ